MRIHLQLPHDRADHSVRLTNLCGALDQHLREIEKAMEVRIQRRGDQLSIEGERAIWTAEALEQLYQQSDRDLFSSDIHATLQELCMKHQSFSHSPARLPSSSLSPSSRSKIKKQMKKPTPSPILSTPSVENQENEIEPYTLSAGRRMIRPRSIHQMHYLHGIQKHDLTFGIGPAGTGKTYLAIAAAVNSLEQGMVQRIILTRPVIEAGEKLGFLPGTLAEKVDPYLRPVYDALHDMLGSELFQRYIERNIIEIAPLAFMRGRTLNEAFIILDEAQNTTPEQMKMFLTRIGHGAHTIVNGDLTQIDLPPHKLSGLLQVSELLKDIDGIGFIYFTHDDVVRHPLVARIIKAYDKL